MHKTAKACKDCVGVHFHQEHVSYGRLSAFELPDRFKVKEIYKKGIKQKHFLKNEIETNGRVLSRMQNQEKEAHRAEELGHSEN